MTAPYKRSYVAIKPASGKDQPILAAANGAGCTHLLTGDARHFGHLYGKRVQGALGTVEAISSAFGVDIQSVLQAALREPLRVTVGSIA